MPNPKRGEASFSAGEGENRREYTLRFSLNTLCSLEDALGRSLVAVTREWGAGDVRISDLRQVVQVAMKGPGMNLEQVGDLIEEAGLGVVLDTIVEAFERSAISDLTEEEGGKGPEDPSKGAPGTGTDSSGTQSQPE